MNTVNAGKISKHAPRVEVAQRHSPAVGLLTHEQPRNQETGDYEEDRYPEVCQSVPDSLMLREERKPFSAAKVSK